MLADSTSWSVLNMPNGDSLSPLQRELMGLLLDEMLESGGTARAPRFRASHWSNIDAIKNLEAKHWLHRENDLYQFPAVVLPLIGSESSKRFLASAEEIYSVFRAAYFERQDAAVLVSEVALRIGQSHDSVAATIKLMLRVSLWSSGWASDLGGVGGHVRPAEAILDYETFTILLNEVRGWTFLGPLFTADRAAEPPQDTATVPPSKQAEAHSSEHLNRAWPAVRACLEKFRFYDIKAIAGLAGFDVTEVAHLVQTSPGGTTKGELMSAVDGQVAKMDAQSKQQFLTILIEEVVRREPEDQELLSEYLSRLGWTFVNQTLVPSQLFAAATLDDTPEEAHQDLLKAAQRLRDGDLGGAISAACGAVDSATTKVYLEFGLGDPNAASFQERCRRAATAKGVAKQLDHQLAELGWAPADIVPFKKNFEGALNQGAYVMQTLRSHMGDVHGTKPIVRSLVFDSLRWAELLVASLVERSE